jgi:hypothetical protein
MGNSSKTNHHRHPVLPVASTPSHVPFCHFPKHPLRKTALSLACSSSPPPVIGQPLLPPSSSSFNRFTPADHAPIFFFFTSSQNCNILVFMKWGIDTARIFLIGQHGHNDQTVKYQFATRRFATNRFATKHAISFLYAGKYQKIETSNLVFRLTS